MGHCAGGGAGLLALLRAVDPEPGRLRQFATQLKDKLLKGASTMTATQGIQMAEQALAALMQ
ncbi:hypothetical protein [Streptomyces sp. NPDC060022]|uniref:hypothetical protein n=1 Tax=Streptomyces sp. NPDC060022 TaxID=3347039 RepID=UPI0036769264